MSKGIYNETYFKNHPEEANLDAVLYCVVLVDKETQIRECIKIGIAKGRDWRHVIKRSGGFKGFDIRIQKTVSGKLEEIYFLEAYLHDLWHNYKYKSKRVFGGHTELFEISKLHDILKSIPNKP